MTPNKQLKTKKEKAIAQEILIQLEQLYRSVRANDAGELFYKLRDYIKQTYLPEEK